jgi:hypothetical protein
MLRLTSPTKTTPTQHSLVTTPSFTPRVRAMFLPTYPVCPWSPSPSSRSNDGDCQDLSQAYAAPPLPALFSITRWSVIALFTPLELYLTLFQMRKLKKIDCFNQYCIHSVQHPRNCPNCHCDRMGVTACLTSQSGAQSYTRTSVQMQETLSH